MMISPANDDVNLAQNRSCAVIPIRAIVILISGMAAAWFAAGSTGLLAHPLQHAITWLALAAAIIAAWPANARSFGTWAILAIAGLLALFFTASSTPTINVLAVSIMLAAIAQTSCGLTRRVALIAAIGATALACFRFACASIPTIWLAADGFGWLLGRIAGGLAGQQLEVGSTFAGLDFLVLTGVVYVGWLVCTVPPRRSRALWMAAGIIIGHFAYLIVLAYSEKLLAMLPDMVLPPKTGGSRVGLWTLTNGLRSLIPWNLPLLAMLIHGGIVAAMVAGSSWLPIIEIDPEKLKRQKAREEKEEIPGSVLAKDIVSSFGPTLLAVAVALFGALSVNQPDIKDKTIVAYERGHLDWLKPDYDSSVEGLYGTLPAFVESLGGKFRKSKDLSKEDLADADVLVLIHPDEPWPQETLERIWDYVRGGGSLLLVAEPAIQEGTSASSFNDVLRPLAMEVRFDTAVTRTGLWEQSYDIMSHPATAGIDDLRNEFGIQLGSSIRTRWPARPTLVGRWGWSDPGSDAATTGESYYNSGELLGDLVLAAEQRFGQGRVFVLGDTWPLQNDGLPNSFQFVGRLLSYMAHRPSSPQAIWRQLFTLAALLAMLALLAGRPAAWQVMLTSTVMGISLACCAAVGDWSGRILPDGRPNAAGSRTEIAYVDASHLEAYDSESSPGRKESHGISELLRTLMRQGYLPLLAPDLTPERLERCGLLISIGPAREFSPAERAAVKQFVSGGGTFICMVGAEESQASEAMLADFGFTIPHTPVRPGDNAVEPEPLGAKAANIDREGTRQFKFYAAWPVKSTDEGEKRLVSIADKDDWALVYSRSVGTGSVVVIGDTHFGCNDNFQPKGRTLPDRILFWRWLFSRVVPGQAEWNPAPGAGGDSSAEPANSDDSKED
jgi:hypothetical protein